MPPSFSVRQTAERSRWFDSAVATALIAAEQREVIPLLATHGGMRGLYLRPSAEVPAALSGSTVHSVISTHRAARSGRFVGDLSFDDAALPIESDALCQVYALHAFDCCAEPVALLDELQRVLRPDGVLFLLGLSPHSAWRLRWAASGVHARSPGRMRSMLAGAGLSVEAQLGLGPVWPSASQAAGVLRPERSTTTVVDPLRPGYLLLARKRRASLTPISSRPRAAVALQPQVGAG